MASKCSSQAAAQALRQLQEQLAIAHGDIHKLKESNSSLRSDARALAEAQHEQLKESEACNAQLTSELGTTQNLLQELRRALEAALQGEALAKAAAGEASGLRDQLLTVREALAEASLRASAAEGRALDAEGRARALQGELGRAESARAAAEERAEGATCAAAQTKEQLAALRAQLSARVAEMDGELQERDAHVERLERDLQAATRRRKAAEARASCSAAEEERALKLEHELDEERTARRRAEARFEQKQGALAELQQEVAVLQQASADHAREMAHARAAADALQSSLDMERGLTSSLNDALQRAEKTLHKVVKLNQALKDSVMRHHGVPIGGTGITPPTCLPPSSSCEPTTLAAARLPSCNPRRHSCMAAGVTREASAGCALGCSCDLCFEGYAPASTATAHGGHAPNLPVGERMPCLRRKTSAGAEARRVPLRPVASSKTANWSRPWDWNGPPCGRERCGDVQRALVAVDKPRSRGPSACPTQTRDQLEAVVLSLEDELAVLDLRYNDLLQAAADADSDDDLPEIRKDALAQTTARVLAAMQQKGQQIRQLRQHIARIGS